MRNRPYLTKRAAFALGVVLLLLAGFGCVALFFSGNETVVSATLRVQGKEVACEFPAVVQKPPVTLGFISWRYTIRASYHFPGETPPLHHSFEASSPPPNGTVMIPIDNLAEEKSIEFDSAEGVLEPYFMNIHLRPLTKKWRFSFPGTLPLSD